MAFLFTLLGCVFHHLTRHSSLQNFNGFLGGIVLLQSFKDYYYGYISANDKAMPGYVDMMEDSLLELLTN